MTVTTAHARLEVNFPLVVGRVFAAEKAPETLLDCDVMPAFFDSSVFFNLQLGICIHDAILLRHPENGHDFLRNRANNPIAESPSAY